jgi:serine/threonine protein kinase
MGCGSRPVPYGPHVGVWMRIGRYEVIGTLGSGGMSAVSLARSLSTRELVVLKRQHDASDDAALMDEARVGLRLNHPHIVETLDLFTHEGRPMLVTAYVSGASISDLRAVGRMPPEVVLKVGRDIASALAFIHSATEEDGTPLEILHRDVTPPNILIGHDGIARLIDLGIARSSVNRRERTQVGFLRGTLRYIAPEVLQGEPYSPKTDLWGLGASLWEGALGRYAISGNDPQVYAQILKGEVFGLTPDDHIDARVRNAVGALLMYEPSLRPSDAETAMRIFDGYLDPEVDADRLAAALVQRNLGPANAFDDEKGTVDEARLLVNRAAATYGSPLGDWRVSSEVVNKLTRVHRQHAPPPPVVDDAPSAGYTRPHLTSSEEQEAQEFEGFTDVVTEILEPSAPRVVVEAPFAPPPPPPPPTRPSSGVVPAPLDLPPPPPPFAAADAAPPVHIDDVPILEIPVDQQKTEVIDIDRRALKAALKEEDLPLLDVAKRRRHRSPRPEDWLMPLTLDEDDAEETSATDPEKRSTPTSS